jgi:glycosyltransferase involved in cell wall biosynthesis
MLTQAATPEQFAHREQLQQFCCYVEVFAQRSGTMFHRPHEMVRYLLAGVPPDIRDCVSQPFVQAVQALLSSVTFDIIHIEHSRMGTYLELVPEYLRDRTLWMLHDIDYSKYARMVHVEPKRRRKLRLWLHSRMMHRWKPRQATKFRCCLVVSETDRQLLQADAPQAWIEVSPNGVDTHQYHLLAPADPPPALLFVGNMGYAPCADAVIYFCHEVLPRIRRHVPETEFWIVGINPPPAVQALAADNGVYVTGRVDTVEPFYRRSSVCVVPLRSGGGTRLKILEAMALGRPVVSTSLGCEGIAAVHNDHLLIADTPDAFAAETLRAMTDIALRERIVERGRELVVTHYDWDSIAQGISTIYHQIAAGHQAGAATSTKCTQEASADLRYQGEHRR